ncbi:hypothetical protein K1719_043301 [Acacia pycnantha]|nr:hypothetical protein K1719_043301 [Acacia pycnantha]
MRSSRKEKLELDDAMIQEQALAAAILFKQHQQNGTLPSFDRFTSLRYPNAGSKKVTLPWSLSSKARPPSPSAMTSKEILHKIKIFMCWWCPFCDRLKILDMVDGWFEL